MLEAAVAFKAAITDFVGHAGHKAHAAPVERGAVEIGTTVLGDSAAEELVAFAGALFAKTTHVAVRGTKEAVAVFLAALIANAFAETLLGLSIGDADFAAVRALLVRLARRTGVLHTSFVTTDLPLRAIGVVTASRLARLAGAVNTALVKLAVAAALTPWRGAGVLNGASIGGVTSRIDRTGSGQKRDNRNSG